MTITRFQYTTAADVLIGTFSLINIIHNLSSLTLHLCSWFRENFLLPHSNDINLSSLFGRFHSVHRRSLIGYFFWNFDENMRRTHEKDLPRIRRTIKNTNQNYLSWLLGNEVPGRGGALKPHEIKYFYELEKEDRNKKSLKIMMQYKSKENMDYRRLFSRYCDSNLMPWSSLYIFLE